MKVESTQRHRMPDSVLGVNVSEEQVIDELFLSLKDGCRSKLESQIRH